MLRSTLMITGALALIAMIPGAVFIGLLMLFLPGLVLALAPTTFAYIATFAVLREAGRATPLPCPWLIAGLATIAIGVLPAVALNQRGKAALAEISRPDVGTRATAALAGDIRFERPASGPSTNTTPDPLTCDAICAAMLVMPAIKSVTLIEADAGSKTSRSATFRLVRDNPPGTGEAPDRPERIVQWLSGSAQTDDVRDAIRLDWALRLASGVRLVRGMPPAEFDRTIRMSEQRKAGVHQVAFRRVEVSDRRGQIIFRRAIATARPVDHVLAVLPQGDMLDQGWGLSRTQVSDRPRFAELNLQTTVVDLVGPPTPVTNTASQATAIRALAQRMTAQLDGGALVAVSNWLGRRDSKALSDDEFAILARVIASPAATGWTELVQNLPDATLARLRSPIAVRLAAPAHDAVIWSAFKTIIERMPQGTYAKLLPEEAALIDGTKVTAEGNLIVARLGDGGAAVAPRLMAMLEANFAVTDGPAKRGRQYAILAALRKLGPEAATLRPQLAAMLTPGGQLWTSEDAYAGRIVLVRMGTPVKDIVLPDDCEGDLLMRERAFLAQAAQFDASPENQTSTGSLCNVPGDGRFFSSN